MSPRVARRALVLIALLSVGECMDFWKGIPGVGHVIGTVRYCQGRTAEGEECMKQASRSTAVAVGAAFAGPGGAAAAGVAYDAIQYGVEKCIDENAKPTGTLGSICSVASSSGAADQGSSTLGLLANVCGDMASGIGGGGAGGAAGKVLSSGARSVSKEVAKSTGREAARSAAREAVRATTRALARTSVSTAAGVAVGVGVGVLVEAEEERRRRRVRNFINVRINNDGILWGLVASAQGVDPRYTMLVASQHIEIAKREMMKLRAHFCFEDETRPANPLLAPDEDGQAKSYPSPLEPAEAECKYDTRGRNPSLCVKVSQLRASPSVFCCIVADDGYVTVGVSAGVRYQCMGIAEGHQGTDTAWFVDNTRIPDVFNSPDSHVPSMRTDGRRIPSAQDDDRSGLRDRCAEHHAALFVYENGHTPISCVAFRMDHHGRIYSVPRCGHCRPYELGFVPTDLLPSGTWLNSPSNLNIYTD